MKRAQQKSSKKKMEQSGKFILLKFGEEDKKIINENGKQTLVFCYFHKSISSSPKVRLPSWKETKRNIKNEDKQTRQTVKRD